MLFVGRLIAIFLEIWGYFMNMARVFESQEMRAWLLGWVKFDSTELGK